MITALPLWSLVEEDTDAQKQPRLVLVARRVVMQERTLRSLRFLGHARKAVRPRCFADAGGAFYPRGARGASAGTIAPTDG